MQITTFFIDRFKEVSLQTPEGFQEEFGVYGLEEEYSPWQLGQEGDTADFLGVSRTNILYGELFRITLDTADLFNPTVPGGTPDINGFLNMKIDEYWMFILDGYFKFNNTTYDQYRQSISRPTTAPGGGGVGPGIPNLKPTLLEYANGVKQRVGWVEVNRTRASIYYEICSNGMSKRARSDHFYDIDKFIMTPDLFNPDNFQIGMFQYEYINPYRATQAAVSAGFMEGENYVTINTISPFSPIAGGQQGGIQRIGLLPVDSWFTWENTQQGHTRTIKNIPDGANNGGFFDMFPWPSGPIEISQSLPQNYLKLLVTGDKNILDATLDGGPKVVKQPVPQGLGSFDYGTPLLLASKEKHLNLLMNDRLVINTQFGIPNPISPVYSVNIWGEVRLPPNVGTIRTSIKSNLQTPSYGVCQLVDGLEGITTISEDENLTIIDPFGLELYDLDSEYKSIYDKFVLNKLCPPRKKVKYNLDFEPNQIPTNSNQLVKVTTGNSEEYNIGNNIKIVKIGPFNPDEQIAIDTTIMSRNTYKGNSQEIKYDGSETNIVYYTETEQTDNGDGFLDTPSFTVTDTFEKKFMKDDDVSLSKNAFRYETSQAHYNEIEVSSGIRNKNQPLLTSPDIPYGTYITDIDVEISPNGTESKTIKILQNGSDADQQEFKTAVSAIVKTAGNDKTKPNPIGVASNGMPIYPKNTLEESMRDIKEKLTGIKEIVFRGSEVEYGAVSYPTITPLEDIQKNPFESMIKKFQYVNTGISVSGVVDLDDGEKAGGDSNLYNCRLGSLSFSVQKRTTEIKSGDLVGQTTEFDQTYPPILGKFTIPSKMFDKNLGRKNITISPMGNDEFNEIRKNISSGRFGAGKTISIVPEIWKKDITNDFVFMELKIISWNIGKNSSISNPSYDLVVDLNYISGNLDFFESKSNYGVNGFGGGWLIYGAISSEEINSQNEINTDKGVISFTGRYITEASKFEKPIYKDGDPNKVIGTQEESFIHKYLDIKSVDNLIINEIDALQNIKSVFPKNTENLQDTPITSISSGNIFLESFGPNAVVNNWIFNVTGTPKKIRNVTGNNVYYKIPVKYVSSDLEIFPMIIGGEEEWDTDVEITDYSKKGGTIGLDIVTAIKIFTTPDVAYKYTYKNLLRPVQRYTGIKLRYSKNQTNQKPKDIARTPSNKNTYGGWVFNGLYHRSGAWPKEHKFRAGLIDPTGGWSPCDGAVDTGAWIQVPTERVRIEKHPFSLFSRETVYNFIHQQWQIENQRRYRIENPYRPGEEGNTILMAQSGGGIKFEPDPYNSDNWQDWEKILDTIRQLMLEDLKDIDSQPLILRLRDNNADSSRGILEIPYGVFDKDYPGHLREFWAQAVSISDNDSIMDSKSNYWFRFMPEPTEHTKGQFKPDEWYKIVFFRSVTSPSSPNGEIASSKPEGKSKTCKQLFDSVPVGKYPANDGNKKTFCDILYVTEQIHKMNRARLIEMKKYIDAKNKNVEDSDSDIYKKSFFRSMTYVDSFKKIFSFFK